ncbi:protein of unknown function [Hyphomicrobium sp. 1Nfss2.1]|uniref:hypothetical protein n=1 Tax=Hyphomicrobium sp. 1Nfss2.1 TaxID=3413936 RepID=UPI003C7E4444
MSEHAPKPTMAELVTALDDAQEAYLIAAAAEEGYALSAHVSELGDLRDRALVALVLNRPATLEDGERKKQFLEKFDLHGDDLFSRLILEALCQPLSMEAANV